MSKDPATEMTDPTAALVAAGWSPDHPNAGDGLAFLEDVPEASVAAAVVDPQYRGVMDKLKLGNEGARQKGRAKLEQMPEETIREFISGTARALRPQGHLFLWVDKFHLCEGVFPWIVGTSLEIVDMLTWSKGRIGMGHRTRRVAEYCVILQKPPRRAKGIWTDHRIPDVVEEKLARGPHPHAKPVALQAALLGAVTRPGDIVIDPAAGSFSTLAACRKLPGRVFFGTDLDPKVPAELIEDLASAAA